MESDDDTYDNDNVDSGNVSSGDDDFAMEVDPQNSRDRQAENDDSPFEVWNPEQIVQHMNDCIKDVNTVVQVNAIFRVPVRNKHDFDATQILRKSQWERC